MRRLAVLIFLALAARAHAEDERATAITLFQDGRQLMAAGRIAEACARFQAAQELAPGMGIELNLAECWARLGRTASAWGAFEHVASLSATTGDPRGPYARARADALAPELARLVVRAPDGVEVRRDGRLLDPALLGTAAPVDPGEHTIDAEAPARVPFSTRVTARPGATALVVVPPLALVPPPPPPEPPPPPAPEPPPPPRSLTRRWIAVGVGGAGLLAIGTATVLAVVARRDHDAAVRDHCDETLACDRTGDEAIDAARTKGNVATVAASIGLAAVVVAVGVAISDRAPARRARLVPRVGVRSLGLVLEGSL